jgi:predicted alpha/beta hydrolase family esterase
MIDLRTTARDLGWWILDYAYAVRWQSHAMLSRTGEDSFRDGSGAPIVIVPGVYETWRFLQPLIERIHALGHPVHVMNLERWNTRPVRDAAEQVVSYLEHQDLSDVTIVAHSKGGLIGKYAMSIPAGSNRVSGMLAVAAPFSGSRYARYLVIPSLRMFSPTNETIIALTNRAALNSRIVSVYGRFDPHIPGGSYLEGAKNVELDAGGHFRVLNNPRVMAELVHLVQPQGDETTR